MIVNPDLPKNLSITKDLSFKAIKLLINRSFTRYSDLIIAETKKIRNEEEQIEILNLCAQKNIEATLFILLDIGIQNEKALFEIVKICAEKDPLSTARYFNHLKIQNEDYRIEIAKICAQKMAWATVDHFQNFEIQNESAKVEIAKLCAEKDLKSTVTSFKKFEIQNEIDRIEIAKLCARINPETTAGYIENFEINTDEAKIEIAEICLQKNIFYIIENIKKFGIRDEYERFKFAKRCAEERTDIIGYFISNFELHGDQYKFEILESILQIGVTRLTFTIQNFDIQEEKFRIKLAEKCAQLNGRLTAKGISYFKISDENALIKIAWMCAKEDISSIAYLNKFGIRNDKALFEIIKYYLKYNFIGTVEVLSDLLPKKNYSFKSNPHEKNPEKFKNFYRYQSDYIENQKIQDVVERREKDEQLLLILDEFDSIEDYLEKHDHLPFKETLYQITEIKDLYAQQKSLHWFRVVLLFLHLDFSDEQIKWISDYHLLEEILNYPSTSQEKFQLFLSLEKVTKNQEARDYYLNSTKKNMKLWQKHALLCSLDLQFKGVDQNLRTTLSTITDKSIFHDSKNYTRLITFLLNLNDIKADEIEKILKKTLSFKDNKSKESQLLENLDLVNIIFNIKKTESLFSEDSLDKIFGDIIRESIPLEGIDNVPLKYLETFGSCREPLALLTYLGKMKSLNEDEITETLHKFITSVWAKNFKEMRYQLDGNKHLATVFENRSELFNLWKRKETVSYNEMLTENLENNSLSTMDWLKMKLIDDQHLDPSTIPFIIAYLKASSDEEKKTIESKLYENPRNNALQITLLNLAKEKNPVKFRSFYLKIKKLIEKHDLQNQLFYNDINGMLQGPVRIKNQDKMIIVDTDNPYDLLLSGTDIAGSCQSINGEPILNRGLLGYLLDGKNRLLAIKTKKGKHGRIVARALLRVLWDKEKQEPVLFLERYYPQNLSAQHAEVLKKMAYRKAEKMGLPLLSLNSSGQTYREVDALGCSIPYEYCDATGFGGVSRYGIFSIKGSKV